MDKHTPQKDVDLTLVESPADIRLNRISPIIYQGHLQWNQGERTLQGDPRLDYGLRHQSSS